MTVTYCLDNKKLIVYTCAWGSYAAIYQDYGKPNMEADLDRLSKEGYEVEIVEVGFNLETVPDDFLIKYLRQTVYKGAKEHAMVFMAVPDQIWAEGSIYNMVKLAEGKQCVHIAAPYQRIDKKKFLENEKPGVYTKKQLVDFCFKYPHGSFINCFDDKDENNSYCGVAGRKIDDNNFVLSHSMPSIWLCQFDMYDVLFWKSINEFGQWDRRYLDQAYNYDRVRTIGCSDLAFAVELTDADKDNPKLKKGLLHNDCCVEEGRILDKAYLIGFRKLLYGVTR